MDTELERLLKNRALRQSEERRRRRLHRLREVQKVPAKERPKPKSTSERRFFGLDLCPHPPLPIE